MNPLKLIALFSACHTLGAKLEKCFKYKHNGPAGTAFNYCLVIDTSGGSEPKITQFKQRGLTNLRENE